MMWFDILKNEMRTVNLPKFKVKPFDVNKPDEDKDDCKDRMFALQNKVKNTPLYDDNSIFDKIRDKGTSEEIEYYGVTKDPSPEGHSEIHGPDHFVSQFYLYPMNVPNAKIKDVRDKSHFEIVVEESRYINNKQAEKIPEEVYCRALDLIAQVPLIVNKNRNIDPYIVGDWKIFYDHREYHGAGNLGFNEWGGVSKRRAIHIHSDKYPYEFHMRNSIELVIGEHGNIPVTIFRLDDALKEIVAHYKNIEFKWN